VASNVPTNLQFKAMNRSVRPVRDITLAANQKGTQNLPVSGDRRSQGRRRDSPAALGSQQFSPVNE
jgi:hypothetical protein